jgi:hypothetical protein
MPAVVVTSVVLAGPARGSNTNDGMTAPPSLPSVHA